MTPLTLFRVLCERSAEHAAAAPAAVHGTDQISRGAVSVPVAAIVCLRVGPSCSRPGSSGSILDGLRRDRDEEVVGKSKRQRTKLAEDALALF
jgi:hypothetical protein